MAEKPSSGRKVEKVALVLAALVLLFLAASKYADYLEKRLDKVNSPEGATLAVESDVDQRIRQLEARLSAGGADSVEKDLEVQALRKELQAVQEEREVMTEKFDEIARQERIAKLGGTPAANPEAGFSKEELMIQRAVPIVNVSGFNKEWGFVMLDGGLQRGLSIGTRLALRRGTELVALVEVSSVEADSAVASLVRGGPGGAGNATPLEGDKAISWPLF